MDLTHWLHSSIIAPLFPAIIDEVINIEAVEDSKPEHSHPKFRILFGKDLGKTRIFFASLISNDLKMSESISDKKMIKLLSSSTNLNKHIKI